MCWYVFYASKLFFENYYFFNFKTDINECAEQSKLCSRKIGHENESMTCINLLGSHECSNITCPKGYTQQLTSNSIVCTTIEPQLDPLSYSRMSHLFVGLFNNQIQGYIQKGYLFYSTNFPEDQQARGPFYNLKLVSATKGIVLGDFVLRREKAKATIWIHRPLPGPAKVHLSLTVVGYKNDQFWREVVDFYINISKYDFYTGA